MKRLILFIIASIVSTSTLFATDIASNEGITLEGVNILDSPAGDAKVIGRIDRTHRFEVISRSDKFKLVKDHFNNEIKRHYFKVKYQELTGWILEQNIAINVDYRDAERSSAAAGFKRYNYRKAATGEVIWFCSGDYAFDTLRTIYTIISNEDGNYILKEKRGERLENLSFIEGATTLKRVELRDIAGNARPEIVMEYNFQGLTDPTNGSASSIIYFDDLKNEYVRGFKKNTAYFSHGMTIALCQVVIGKDSLEVTNFENSGDGTNRGYSEASVEDKGNFRAAYNWNGDGYELVKRVGIGIKCTPTVKSLRIREGKKLDSKQLGSIGSGEKGTLQYIPWFGRGDKYLLINNKKGMWVQIRYDKMIGYSYSYYLDFGYDFLNEILKSDGSKSLPWEVTKEYRFVSYR